MTDLIATDATPPEAANELQVELSRHLGDLCKAVKDPATFMLIADTSEAGFYLLAGNRGEPSPVNHVELVAAALSGLGNLMRPPAGHKMHNAPAISLGLAVMANYAAQQLGLHEQETTTVGELTEGGE